MQGLVTIQFTLEDLDGKPISETATYEEAIRNAEHAIRNRLMGDGFLPADLCVGDYNFCTRIED